jgi:hypothetical protein
MIASLRINIILFAAILLICSCAWFRKASKHKPESPLSITDIKIADSLLLARQFDYQWLSAKCKIKFNTDEGSSAFIATVRSKKDSAIWISVSPLLGIEALRLFLTTDSIFVLDRLTNKRSAYGYDYLRRYTTVPLNYSTMQQLVAGTAIYYNPLSSSGIRQDTTLVLTSETNQVRTTLYLNSRYLLHQMFLESLLDKAKLDIQLQSYIDLNGKSFATRRMLSLHDELNTTLELEFSKMVLNEAQKFPFPIK